jgi:hypothetical protein
MYFLELCFEKLVNYKMNYGFTDSEITGSYSLIKALKTRGSVNVFNAMPGALRSIFTAIKICLVKSLKTIGETFDKPLVQL